MFGINTKRRNYFVNREVQMQFAALLVFVGLLTSIQLFASIFVLDSNLEQEAARYGLDQDPVTLSFIIVQQKAMLILIRFFSCISGSSRLALLVSFLGFFGKHLYHLDS